MDEAAPAGDQIELDLRGLKCPMPTLQTRKALRRLAVGQALRVSCTDPLAAIDIPNLVREDGHRLAATVRSADTMTFVVIKQIGRGPRADL